MVPLDVQRQVLLVAAPFLILGQLELLYGVRQVHAPVDVLLDLRRQVPAKPDLRASSLASLENRDAGAQESVSSSMGSSGMVLKENRMMPAVRRLRSSCTHDKDEDAG